MEERLRALAQINKLHNEHAGYEAGEAFGSVHVQICTPTWQQLNEVQPVFGWPTTKWNGEYAFLIVDGVEILWARNKTKEKKNER